MLDKFTKLYLIGLVVVVFGLAFKSAILFGLGGIAVLIGGSKLMGDRKS